MGHIRGVGRVCHRESYGNSDRGDGYNGRGMGGLSCQEIIIDVSASGFGAAVMTEKTSICRKGIRKSERESRERTTCQNYRHGMDGD